jgi:hypothetical protein
VTPVSPHPGDLLLSHPGLGLSQVQAGVLWPLGAHAARSTVIWGPRVLPPRDSATLGQGKRAPKGDQRVPCPQLIPKEEVTELPVSPPFPKGHLSPSNPVLWEPSTSPPKHTVNVCTI